MHVPVLTYHANNINGMEYSNNDHIALTEDLALIHELGIKIISLDQLLAWHAGQLPDAVVENSVVLTCDDGTDFDYHDINHPDFGVQISFFNILRNHQKAIDATVHMTNFVIVSPAARVVLDQKCLVGKGWWQDDWWQLAQDSGLMTIANHSWDHNHGVLENNNVDDDSFRCINDKNSCDIQIRQAQTYLNKHIKAPYQANYFAYPYGNFSDYLRFEYLPEFGHDLGLKAAFTTAAAYVEKDTDVWAMPRFVANNDWKNTRQLRAILLQD